MIDRLTSSDKTILLFLFLLTFLCYFWILPAPFKTVDDYFCIVGNPQIKDIKFLPQIFTASFFGEKSYYRPLVYVSYMAEYHFFGLNSFFYNLTNLLLHGASAFGVFLLISFLTRDRTTGFWTSVLFVLHPIHWEAVTNIPGRSILLCAVFFIYSVYFFMKFMDQQEGGRGLYIFSLIFFILSLLSKESAIFLPLVLVSYVVIRPESLYRRRKAGFLSVYFLIVLGYLLLRRHFDVTPQVSWGSMGWLFVGVITFLKTLIGHTMTLLFPRNLHFDRSEPLVVSVSTALWVLSFWVFVIVKLAFHLRNRLIWFFLGWIALNLVIVSQIVSVRVSAFEISAADHFLYLPSIGFFAIVVIGIRNLFQYCLHRRWITRRTVNIISVGYLVFLWITTLAQTVYSREQIAMFTETLKHSPNNKRVRLSLASAYAYAGRFDLAEENYRKVLLENPFDVRGRIGLGVALCDQEKCVEALKEYDKISAAGQLQDLLANNKERAVERVIKQYQTLSEKEPDKYGLHYSLGVMYGRLQKNDEAVIEFQKELEKNPNHPDALFNLASYSAAEGRKDEAIKFFERFLEVADPHHPLYQNAKDSLEKLK